MMFTKTDSLSIKGFAVLLMLYYHVVIRQGYSAFPGWSNFWYTSGNVCVALFAFISVYGIAKKRLTGTNLTSKK